ncbi:MAG: MBL fold metallo-hydrolase [Patescibacteria group bacterium]
MTDLFDGPRSPSLKADFSFGVKPRRATLRNVVLQGETRKDSGMVKWKKITLLLLAALAIFVWYAVFTIGARGTLEVTFFDVGQGDAALIQINDGKQILIDGGPGKTILTKLGSAMPYWDREIELVILTHPHADHVDGLIEVLKQYDVKIVLDSSADYHTADYAEWRRLLEEKQISVVIARAGQRVHLSDFAYLDILTPLENFVGASPDHIHDAMVIARLYTNYASNYGSPTSILFSGDAERRLEFELATRMPDLLDADILKVGHHGSKTSSSELFLKAVSPEMAIISVGHKNNFGHPHESVLKRLESLGIPIRRTDIEGDIKYTF